jgi:hypothetical protein
LHAASVSSASAPSGAASRRRHIVAGFMTALDLS